MKIGMTYDLRQEYLALGYGEEQTAEFDRPETVEAVELALRRLGHEVVRVGHVRSLVTRLASGECWDLVFNFAEGLFGFAREAQVPALLDAYQIPYTFSDGLVLSVTLHKATAKRVLRDLGLPTPDFWVVESVEDICEVHAEYPLFAKPIAEGTGKGVLPTSRVTSRQELEQTCTDLLSRFEQPVLVETYLPGREFTVGIVGTGRNARAVGVMEVVLLEAAEQHAYSYVNKEKCEQLVRYEHLDDACARRVEDLALRAHRGLGCRDVSRVDLREDANGELSILEVNPIPGLHPEHSDLPILSAARGISFERLISDILGSASRRIAGPKTK